MSDVRLIATSSSWYSVTETDAPVRVRWETLYCLVSASMIEANSV